MSEAEQSLSPSVLHRVFYGPSELRAGWRLLIFLAIVIALINVSDLMVSSAFGNPRLFGECPQTAQLGSTALEPLTKPAHRTQLSICCGHGVRLRLKSKPTERSSEIEQS